MTPYSATLLQARVRAFTGGRVETHHLRVEADGSVLVWDSVARHYTRCHAISPSAQRRIRKMVGV